jgi:hypothetical protein
MKPEYTRKELRINTKRYDEIKDLMRQFGEINEQQFLRELLNIGYYS